MAAMNDRGSTPVIAASELGQHAYCARSWWLGRVKGYPSAHWQEMAEGRAAHQAHGRVVVRYHRLQRLAWVLLVVAVLLAVVGLILLARGW
jgi:hypothetical protein